MPVLPGYDALLRGTAWVRRTDRAVVRLRGADRVTWLQGLITNDIAVLEPGPVRRSLGDGGSVRDGGQRIYSAYLTPQGRMITDLWVVATPDSLLLDVPAPLATSLAASLDALIIAEDVQIDDESATIAVLQVFGSAATDGANPATDGTDPATDGTDARMEVGVARAAIEIFDSTFGVPSRIVYLPATDVDRFISELPVSYEGVGLDALEVLRVEAGVPRFLIDMTGETIPLEAGLEQRAISFTKGCYVGQEVIVRVTTRGGGRVARRLVGVRVENGAEPPPSGAALHAGERAVGRITSAVFSPRCSGVIALGYVHRDFTEPGTRLEVHHDARSLAAVVHPLPFVQPA
jgi:folate-binding protein YgfZ